MAKSIVTGNLTTMWSNLNKLDTMFSTEGVHNITVLLTPELEASLIAEAKILGVKKINGIYEKDGVRSMKFKTSLYAKKGVTQFPCQDASSNFTDVVPWKGDVVRLRVAPILVTKGATKSVSFFLNGVQIVEKNSVSEAKVNGFGEVDGGYVGNRVDAPARDMPKTSSTAPTIVDEDLPF